MDQPELPPEMQPRKLVTEADAIMRHQAAIRADVNVNTRRRERPKKQTKAQRVLAQMDQRSMFDPVIQPGSTYRAAEQRAAQRSAPTPERPKVLRVGKSRCSDCDRTYLVRDSLIVCPSCGTIVGRTDQLGQLMEAFSVTEVIERP